MTICTESVINYLALDKKERRLGRKWTAVPGTPLKFFSVKHNLQDDDPISRVKFFDIIIFFLLL